MTLRTRILLGLATLLFVTEVVSILIHDLDGVTPALDSEFKWQVYLQGDANCGGVIVRKDWVLTAAHCVHSEVVTLEQAEEAEKMNPVKRRAVMEAKAPMFVQAGKKTPVPGEGTPVCEKAIIHKDYKHLPNQHRPWDIALLHLPLTLDATKAVAKLNTTPGQDTSKEMFVAGWVCASRIRRANPWMQWKPITKFIGDCGGQMIYAPVMPHATCMNEYLCAGSGDEAGFNYGDSGSGLTVDRSDPTLLFGIANIPEADKDWYARVSYYQEWVERVIKTQTHSPDHGDDCEDYW